MKSAEELTFTNKGFWRSHGQKYLKLSNKGFCGLGIKSFLKERPNNGFKFIDDRKLESKLYHQVDNNYGDRNGCLVLQNNMFEVDQKTITENRDYYISLVKKLAYSNFYETQELFQSDCIILK